MIPHRHSGQAFDGRGAKPASAEFSEQVRERSMQLTTAILAGATLALASAASYAQEVVLKAVSGFPEGTLL